MNDHRDLATLIRSRVPVILLETREELRALELLKNVARETKKPLFKWSVTEGLLRMDPGYLPQKHNRRPEDVLGHIKSAGQPGIFLLLDLHPFFPEPQLVRLIKEIAQQADRTGQTLVLLSHDLKLPEELRHLAAHCRLALPDADQLTEIVREEADRWTRENGRRVQTRSEILQTLVRNLSGLSGEEARRLARRAIWDDGALNDDDLHRALRAKYELLNRSGVLTFEPDTRNLSETGGLARLKEWLSRRRSAFLRAPAAPGLPVPRGILLTGVQGCGKSLAAKAVAGTWQIPLLRLDFGAVYNKYIGETERNLREALETAEGLAPCVLWLDEIEKGVAVGDEDGGTSRRVLGTLLTWMAERTAATFTIATANQIERLPPELIRKGRFDEIFFLDLPDDEARRGIFQIHLKKRGLEPDGFDLPSLIRATDGFSGAEIEQVVVAAFYTTDGEGTIDGGTLLKEIRMTRPLSVIMAENVAALRAWAATRTVPAD